MSARFYQYCSTFCLSLALLMGSFFSLHAQADMISTHSSIQTEHEYYTKQQVLDALESEELRQQLEAQGVDADTVKAKIASLTPGEIDDLNEKLQNEQAGAGVAGVVAFIFVALIVTDMFCVTDVFNFVNCI